MRTYQSRLLISLYKVDNKKEKLEDFKTAISSTVRSISNSEKIEVSFGNQTPKSEKNSIKLPELSQINNRLNFDQIELLQTQNPLISDFQMIRHLSSMNLREISPKDFIKFQKKLDVKK